MHRKPLFTSAAALVLAACVLAAPSAGFTRETGSFDRGERGSGIYHDHGGNTGWHQDERREHRGHNEHWWYHTPGLFSVPPIMVLPPIAPFMGTRPLGATMPTPIQPPVRFRYYCDQPPGWFPAVSACRVPWRETGAPP